MAVGFPDPLDPFAPGALALGELIGGPAEALLKYLGVINDTSAAGSNIWMRVALSFKLTDSIINADTWYTTFDIVKMSGGQVQNNWTTQDHANVKNAMVGIVSTYLTLAPSQVVWTGQKHYQMSFTPAPTYPLPPGYVDKPFFPTGPPVYVDAGGGAGSITVTSLIPSQNAVTVTEKTAYPAHWGRNYWPQLASTQYDVDGYVKSTAVDSMANQTKAQYSTLISQGLMPVVVSTQQLHVYKRALLTVTQIQCDNNPDVVRRRRKKQTTYRKTI